MNDVDTARDAGPSAAPRTLSRRGVLGAIAVGTVATACRGGDGLALPDPDAIAGGGGGGGGGTSTTLAQVEMPTRQETTPLPGGGSTTSSAPGVPTTQPGSNMTTATLPAPGSGGGGGGTTTTTPAPGATTPVTAAPNAPTTTVFSSPVVLGSNATAIHVGTRLTFGVTPTVFDQINTLGTGGFLEDQLARTGPDPEVEATLEPFQLLGLGLREAFDQTREDEGRERFYGELTHSNLVRAVSSSNQLYEMMVHLWMDHFNVNLTENGDYRHLMLDYQENVIRPNAMGSFRDLLRATAASPAMMIYLNNADSNANADNGINENYGRELLELHTLGIDENGAQVYTEADVRASALAMTGWSVDKQRQVRNENRDRVDNPAYSAFVFRDDFQFAGEISLLNGAWTRGTTTGQATGESLLDFLATHPSTARYVALKLARRFVSDTPSAALLDATAQVYLESDTAIVPTLRFLLSSEEFAAAESQKMRRPFEVMAATIRALAAEVPTDPTGDAARRIRRRLEDQGNRPWGWDPPDGFPEEAGHWLSTNGLLNRWNLSARLARNGDSGRDDGDRIQVDYNAIRPQSANVSELITNLGRQFGLGDLPVDMVGAIADAAGLDPAAAPQLNDEQLADVAGLLFAHPLFQTR